MRSSASPGEFWGKMPGVERVLVLGRGGAGKSTFARRLGAVTGVPVVDAVFWAAGLDGLSRAEWVARQRELSAGGRCAWRAVRRGRERWDFWWWVLTYRWRHLPSLRTALAASDVDVVELRSPRAVRAFLSRAG